LANRGDGEAMAGILPSKPEVPIRLASFDQYRSLLFSIAYRMLGSVADAEDMLQETFIRWQQAPEQEIRSPRAFLITIISRLCINHLQSARAQREQYVGQWLPEPIVTAPGSDPLENIRLDESLSMAFLLMLERLTPVERAVFVLRDVFEYEYPELATILGESEVNCRQILHRARQHVTDTSAVQGFSAAEERPAGGLSTGDEKRRLGGIGRVAGRRCGASLRWRWQGSGRTQSNSRRKECRPRRTGYPAKADAEESGPPPGPGQWGTWDRQLSRREAVLRAHPGGRRRAHPDDLCCNQP